MSTTTKASKLHAYAEHCGYASMGAESVYKHPFGKLVYTSGVKFTADTFGAYWLIDLIASHQPAIRLALGVLDMRDFQVWTLHKVGDDWTAEAWSDTPNAPSSYLLAKQVIGYSDFPEELDPFLDFWVENGTLMLRQER